MALLLQAKNICKHYGAAKVLDNANLSLFSDQKIGVIGRNGAGKSTFCRIIIGQEEMDSGEVIKTRELRLSYLEQQDPYTVDETVIDFLMRYTGKEEWECGEVAGKFKLKGDILYTTIGELAGGYRTRVKLTAMLLKEPNFLILDEPTNYLDLSTLILLENFLQGFNGGFMIVSHDREFLKRTCDHTLEVEHGELTMFPGSIEEYFEFKEVQLSQMHSHNKNVGKKMDQLQQFISRFGAKSSLASRAKSKQKQLNKLEKIEISHPMSHVRIKVPPVEKKNGVAFSCDGLSIGYPDKLVAKKIKLDIPRGAHVAIVGDNGQGKTTFLRTIANDLTPKEGGFQWGAGLKVGYYAQHVYTAFQSEDDVIGYLSRHAGVGVTSQDVLNMAGSFLFQGDDTRKKVSVLSGGERARLCLAGILLNKNQVILLDEPTNHLDAETVEALAHALKTFLGTVLFISHDRTFVNIVATAIVDVKGGSVKKYPGTYEEYVHYLQMQAANNN